MDPFYGSIGGSESGNCPIFSSSSRLADCPDEAVAHGEQGSLSLGVHSQLGVDVLEVRGYCLAAQVQLGGNLGVGPSLAQPYEHLGLAPGQP
jgi:hypothetical protein